MEKYIINPITREKILSTEFIVSDYFIIKEENQQLKEQLERSERARKEAIEYIKGAGEMATYTKSIALYEEELEELLDILDIDKGE